jgi:hypothetical protein
MFFGEWRVYAFKGGEVAEITDKQASRMIKEYCLIRIL